MTLSLALTSVASHAAGSTEHSSVAARHSGEASKHSVYSIGTGAQSIAQTASTAVAVPLLVAGGTLAYSGGGKAQGIYVDSKGSEGGLPITDTTVIADPAPNKVMKN